MPVSSPHPSSADLTARAAPASSAGREHFDVRATAMPGVIAVEALSHRSFSRHTHDQFGIGVILDGAQDSASGRGPVRAERGQLITVNPNEVHDGLPVRGGRRHWRMLYFEPEVIAHVADDLTARRGCELAYPVLDSPVSAGLFLALHRSLTNPTGNAALAAESLLMDVVAPFVAATARVERPAPLAVAHARALIDAEPARSVTLEALAQASGLSRFHFLRSFRAATGLPPHAYQVQKRLHLARRLISDGLSLAEAAAGSGFADQAHLTRHFTRAFGIRPGALRRAVAGGRTS